MATQNNDNKVTLKKAEFKLSNKNPLGEPDSDSARETASIATDILSGEIKLFECMRPEQARVASRGINHEILQEFESESGDLSLWLFNENDEDKTPMLGIDTGRFQCAFTLKSCSLVSKENSHKLQLGKCGVWMTPDIELSLNEFNQISAMNANLRQKLKLIEE